MSSPAHKPRRKPKRIGGDASGLGSVSQWEILPLILMGVGLFRWAAGLWGYSGFQNPPMFGDYEAQRHWMEITTGLPISQWYFHDLEWWGLDYPPLTAYHSAILGWIGKLINPSWFALHTSRGIDDSGLKVFMRATVMVSEYLVYVPAAVIFVRRFSRLNGVHTWDASVALVAILMAPGLILIDHVHFQYNSVMLGLVLSSMSSILAGRLHWACVFFVLALGFKQMALYYAPAIFAYLLGVCVFPRINLGRLITIAAVTLVTFGLLVLPIYLGALYDSHRGISATSGIKTPLPFLGEYFPDGQAWYYPIVQQTTQILHRVFPFARGLFEDKVANFWCALNVIIKLREYPTELLQRASLLATLAGILPPCLIIFFKPERKLVPLALATTSWAFFLFSFQVHEKSVLLPLMPMTLLFAGKDGFSYDTKCWVGLANILGAWTMFPLLSRVDLRTPYFVFVGLYIFLLYIIPAPKPTVEQQQKLAKMSEYEKKNPDIGDWTMGEVLTLVVVVFTAQSIVVWHVLEALVEAPEDLPDIYVVVNVGVGAIGFGLCYLWCLIRLATESCIFGAGAKVDLQKKKQ